VSDEEIERLNNRARSVMYDLSSTLLQSQAQLQRPTPYMPKGQFDDPTTYGGGPTPTIPPIIPLPAPGPTPAATPTPVANVGAVPTPTASGVGPVLGSAGPVATLPASATPPGTGMITPPPPTPATGQSLLPATPGILPTTSPVVPTTVPSNITKPGSVAPVAASPRAMPPGGLIGAPPGAGLAQPAPAPARRVNPVGGVIGGASNRPTATAPMLPPGGGGRPAGAPSGVTSARRADGTRFAPHAPSSRRRTNSEDAARKWDPDNPWEIADGVAPVVRPAQESGRIDPGPVIGLDR
jgi:hypothetical protein